MVDKPDGGPAFPRPYGTDEHTQPCNVSLDQQGMSLRDYFAGESLAGIRNSRGGGGSSEARAKFAYLDADAMLAERAK